MDLYVLNLSANQLRYALSELRRWNGVREQNIMTEGFPTEEARPILDPICLFSYGVKKVVDEVCSGRVGTL
jgi:hypothetical protein